MNHTSKIRSFIGIKPNQATMTLINEFKQQHQNAAWAKHIRWTREENIHLTVRFLGDLVQDQIDTIKNELRSLLSHQAAFNIRLNSPTPFPTLKKARMLACLVHANPELTALAAQINKVAIRAGVADEGRAFRGHLTIGRFRNRAKGLADLLASTQTVTMPVDHVVFYKSDLQPGGAVYSKIEKYSLQIKK